MSLCRMTWGKITMMEVQDASLRRTSPGRRMGETMAERKATKRTSKRDKQGKASAESDASGLRLEAGEEEAAPSAPVKMTQKAYERELARLQIELVKLQEWIKHAGLKVIVLFEGRDAAGKGGAIKRITEFLNPRICRVVALGVPTERQRTQWYFQRYVEELPAAGEMVLFDRSWYNRAGIEKVLGFCTPAEHQRFLRQCPIFERQLVDDGINLLKYWFSVSDDEQA